MKQNLLPFMMVLVLGGCTTEPVEPLGYCYATLADVVCYDQPDLGRDGRLVGTLEGPPA